MKKYSTVKERIEILVKYFGSIGNLSHKTKVSHRTLENYLYKEGANPDLGILSVLSKGTGCSLIWLQTGEGEIWPEGPPPVPTDTRDPGIPGRIRELAERLGSRPALSEASGVPRNTIDQLISGRRQAGDGVLHRLAAGAGVSLEWLRTGHEAEEAEGETLTDADRLELAAGQVKELKLMSREDAEVVARALLRLLDPEEREKITDHLRALEMITALRNGKDRCRPGG